MEVRDFKEKSLFDSAVAVSTLSNIAASFIIIFQIMVNHQVPETALKIPEENIDWGVYQVATAHNYAVNSKLFLHLSGIFRSYNSAMK